MTPDKNNPWTHFAEAFQHFDRGWEAADRGFSTAGERPEKDRKTHTLTASTWKSRWKLFRVFNRVAWKLLVRGSCTIRL